MCLGTDKPGLYIHVPFCRSKCPYCNFYSIASISEGIIDKFLHGLSIEARYYQSVFPQPFDTIYIGGGTPTVLKERQLEEIFLCIDSCFSFIPYSEITIEANPGDIDLNKARFLRSLGINRISLGIQSFNDDILKFLGRRHTRDDAIRSFEILRRAGFENISIDLIYAIPGQSLLSWFKDLNTAVNLRPEHISCYELTIEKKTIFWKKWKKGGLSLPKEEEKANFFIKTSSFLEKAGYIHYEVSNFAKEKDFISKHNSKYWTHRPYLGLGPSAHSFDGKKRWWNFSSIKKYYNALKNDSLPLEGQEYLTDEMMRIEKIFLGLRTINGIKRHLILNISDELLDLLKKNGLIIVKGDKIVPTKKGLSLADQLSLYLI